MKGVCSYEDILYDNKHVHIDMYKRRVCKGRYYE